MPRLARLLTIAVVGVVASGCIGATDRADFDREVRARGGGVSTTWISESLDALATEVATTVADLDVITLTITGPNRSISAVARRGDRPDFVDTVVVREGEVIAVTPMQDADELPLDDITYPVDELPLDQIENLSDQALAEFADTEGFVSSISVSLQNGEPVLRFSLASPRQTATVSFDIDGRLLEVER